MQDVSYRIATGMNGTILIWLYIFIYGQLYSYLSVPIHILRINSQHGKDVDSMVLY